MIDNPIELKDLSLSFPQKTCFQNFSTKIYYGSRIAIIGNNGSGKSTLLRMLQGEIQAFEGKITIPKNVVIGYVAQIIETYNQLSGSERFNKALTKALALEPDILLLDEPTNHLDQRNRKSLMRLLNSYTGTLIIVSHDVEILKTCVDMLWHIDNGQIHIFKGNYDDYMREISLKRAAIEYKLSSLNRLKKETHKKLMKEQERAKKSDLRGQKSIQENKWPTIVSDEKARRALETTGKKKRLISDKREDLVNKLAETRLPEILVPKFSITAADLGSRTLISITDGSIKFNKEVPQPFLANINLQIASGERIAILGHNASGKSTLVKAILDASATNFSLSSSDSIRGSKDSRNKCENDNTRKVRFEKNSIFKSGAWLTPKLKDIGYLDQHYRTLSFDQTAYQIIENLAPHWSHAEIRSHLNDFLFRKNEEVQTKVANLSGGEKARLCLAQISAKTPKLLILDEITNNIDLETRNHTIQVLKNYPGTLIVISHDQDFLESINITKSIDVSLFSVF